MLCLCVLFCIYERCKGDPENEALLYVAFLEKL